jgi:hypothetical protein
MPFNVSSNFFKDHCLQLLDAGGVAPRLRQVGAFRKFPGIELKPLPIPGEFDLRPVFAFHRGTASAQGKEEFRRRSPAIGSVKGGRRHNWRLGRWWYIPDFGRL